MTLSKVLFPLNILLATVSLAWIYTLDNHQNAAILLVGLGACWVIGHLLSWRWMGHLVFTSFVVATATGSILDLRLVGLLTGVAAAIVAWDLEQFTIRVQQAERIEDASTLERHHLQHLGFVIGLGVVLAVAALRIRVRFGLVLAMLLVLSVVVGLGRVISFWRRESQ